MKGRADAAAQAALAKLVEKHGTQRAAAQELGIGEVHLSQLLHGRKTFTDAILEKLGLQWAVVKRSA